VNERTDTVRIETWSEGDLSILQAALGDPQMTEHVGGPESAEKILERHGRYEKPDSKQYKIVDVASGEGAGWVGYWDKTWRGGTVYEVGWSVLPRFQGRGFASAATAQLIELARAEKQHQYVHAFPSIHNGPSNGICRKLGFELLGEYDFEYPPGNMLRCNDWRFDLFPKA
jgi:RimJ/RimL family protein N-acetyltransferase